ncbi:MAG: biotin transporter BioY [Gammaproteobacteria bacterium]|nr:biotin transporter BioY [Gammaproteobacteria bacterium]
MIHTETAQLASILWSKNNNILKETFLVFSGVILLAIASQLSIPFTPVPLTFQSATVVLIGMILGAKRGSYVLGVYLTAGLLGLPVFAEFAQGPIVFMGPTGGYLLGFLPAAMLSGYLAEKGFGQSMFKSFVAALCGVTVILTFGYLHLALLIGFENAFKWGVQPFLLPEAVKLFFASLLIPRFWRNQ